MTRYSLRLGGRLGYLAVVLWTIIALSATVLTAAFAASQTTIDSIRRGTQQGGKTRIVIESSAPLPYRAFLLAGPNRLVVDVPTSTWRATRNGFFQDRSVNGYRSGDLADGLTRIVFDLKAPVMIDTTFALPATGSLPDRLVIDLEPSTQNLFNVSLDRVHGDANLRNRAMAAAPAPAVSPQRAIANQQIAGIIAPNQQLPMKKPGYLQSPTQAHSATAQGFAPPPPPLAPASASRRVIIIDAGHGGHDPGAIAATKAREKEITLAMARALKQELENTGRYKVYMTRETDIFIPLRQRVAFARQKKGDLFISLHADKVARGNVRGASIYTLSENASDAESARLAEQENMAGVVAGVDLSGEEADVADILLDLAMREKMNESNLLARYLEDTMRRKNIRLLPNSHRSAGFAVLKAPDIPSALIEIGFLSNKDEAKLLTTKEFQSNMARALREGIDAYFTKIIALQKI